MTTMDKDHASSIIDLAEQVVPLIESAWGCLIEADQEILEEAAGRADLTLEHVGMEQPNEIKQAGHYAFWLRKLKPLRILDPVEHAEVTEQLVAQNFLKGGVHSAQSMPRHARRLYVNEAFSLVAAIGIARTGGIDIAISPSVFNDLTVNLRYHSFSPSALSSMLNAYAR